MTGEESERWSVGAENIFSGVQTRSSDVSTRVYKTALRNIREGRAPLAGLEESSDMNLPEPGTFDEIAAGSEIFRRAVMVADEARANLLSNARATIERVAGSVNGNAWPIAKTHAGERALELLLESKLAAEELVAATNATRILADANAMPVGTYSAETMRELYLVAVHQPDADLKPGRRQRKAIRRIAAAWHECTGKKPSASYDVTKGSDRKTPFVEFAKAALDEAGADVSLRKIRSSLAGTSQKGDQKLVV
jgi:hypothetical protein